MRTSGLWQWSLALVVGLCLVGAAGVWAERHAGPTGNGTGVGAGEVHVAQMPSTFREVIKQVLPSVVAIDAEAKTVRNTRETDFPLDEQSPFGDLFKQEPRFREFFKRLPEQRSVPRLGRGTGFVIDASGVILTNSHVVADAERVKVRFSDGREYVASEIHTDPRTDVAVIRLHAAKDLVPVALGDSDAVEMGDWVLAMGSPFGLDHSVTHGIISGKSRGPGINEREDYLQTDAAINPGNSGGPLVDMSGRVIGINTAISSRGGGSDGVGFTIPINMAKWVADQLLKEGRVHRAYLGVGIQKMDSALAEKFGVTQNGGALINKVMPDSPAAAAKLAEGDVVVEVNGRAIHGPRDLQGAIEQQPVDKPIDVVVMRDGKRVPLKVTVKAMPEDFALTESPTRRHEESEPQAKKVDKLGLEVAELTPAVAKRLGLPDSQGVVIASVSPDGPAAKAGLASGLIVEKVDGRDVKSPTEFQAAVEAASLEKGVLLLVRSQEGGARFVVVGK